MTLMNTRLLRIEISKYISFEVTQYDNNRKATTVYYSVGGWVSQYSNAETLYQVIVNEIRTIKAKIKSNKKDISLKQLLSELKQERIKQSQLTLF
jgi:hypothetical protein